MEQLDLISLTLLAIVSSFIAFRLYLSLRRLRARHAPIVDADAELARVKEEIARTGRERQQESQLYPRQKKEQSGKRRVRASRPTSLQNRLRTP